MIRVLGIDYGARFVGFSIADTGNSTRFHVVETFDALLFLTQRCAPNPNDPSELASAMMMRFRRIVDEYEPRLVAIESGVRVAAVKGRKGRQSVASLQSLHQLGEFVGLCKARSLPVIPVEPGVSNRSMGMSGLSDKQKVAAFERRYRIDLSHWPVKNIIHGVEAACVGVVGARMWMVTGRQTI